MAGVISPETPTAGISRSGRIRKKSAKVIEMEETEKTVESVDKPKPARTPIGITNNGVTPKKTFIERDLTNSLSSKRLKIKIPPINDNFKDTVMMEGDDDDIADENIDDTDYDGLNMSPTINSTSPPINSGTALGVLPVTTVIPSSTPLPAISTLAAKKHDKSPKKSTSSDTSFSELAIKPIKISRKMVENDSAANKLFEQITSGQPHIDHRRKGFRRKFKYGIVGNVDFGSDDNDSDEASLVIANDPQDSLASAMAHVNKMKTPKAEPVPEVEEKEEKKPKRQTKAKLKTPLEGKTPEKKKRGPLITAYTLFARENRSKIAQSNPHLDFAGVSKRLGEVWQTLPNKEKMQWKRKAAKMAQNMHRASDPISSLPSKSTSSHSKSSIISKLSSTVTPKYSTKSQESTSTRKNDGGYVDVACHLKLIGDSLTNIGQRLNDRPGLASSVSLSVLLDSTICAMGSLVGLTRLVEHSNGCPKEVHDKLMDNISFIMPGI
ncbi:uncharacterized protein LOC107363326 [Tetranychus urticae]|uniref:HMG box domain-containing protein n=1 Tax=Tetranychus urticae TaxID=32264 RepID=T1KEE0_TETUR|nr:uncharacterized protein LOC107363326 [Tetranychus urticae]